MLFNLREKFKLKRRIQDLFEGLEVSIDKYKHSYISYYVENHILFKKTMTPDYLNLNCIIKINKVRFYFVSLDLFNKICFAFADLESDLCDEIYDEICKKFKGVSRWNPDMTITDRGIYKRNLSLHSIPQWVFWSARDFSLRALIKMYNREMEIVKIND